MDKEKQKKYSLLIKSLGQLLAFTKLYNMEHAVVKKKTTDVFTEINTISDNQPIVFSELDGVFLVNDEVINQNNRMIEQLVQSFRWLGIGSLNLEPGMKQEEFNALVWLWGNSKKFQGIDEVKKYFGEKGVTHIIPYFATYKMVKEDEVVVKEAEVLKLGDVPGAAREQFLQHLNKGSVVSQIKAGDKLCQFLAHEPTFLTEKTLESVKDQDNPETLEKLLWAIGSYLIEETTTASTEAANRRVINELKDSLLGSWEKNEGKAHLKKDADRILTGISAALQVKGLTLLYKKHKKGLESTTKKLKKIYETLPEQSVLRQKTQEDLQKLGVI